MIASCDEVPLTVEKVFEESAPVREVLLRTKRLVVVAVFETIRFVVDERPATVSDGVVMVPVAVSVPTVEEPMTEDEPVMDPFTEPVRLPEIFPVTFPVTFPVRFPVIVFETTRLFVVVVPVTTRLVVVAVPETTSCEVDADDVAVSVPTVAAPSVALPMTFPVTFPVRLPVITPETERFEALMFAPVIFPADTPRKVEVPDVAVKLKPVMLPKTSRSDVVVVFEAPIKTWAVVVDGR